MKTSSSRASLDVRDLCADNADRARPSSFGLQFILSAGDLAGICYRDGLERALALMSLARTCRDGRTSLLFVGAAGASEEARGTLRRLDGDAASHVIWREFHWDDKRDGDAGSGLRAVLLEACVRRSPGMVWVELASLNGTWDLSEALCRYAAPLAEIARTQSLLVFGALPLSAVSENASLLLLTSFASLIDVERLNRTPLSVAAICEDEQQTTEEPKAGVAGGVRRMIETDGGQLLQYERLAALGQLAAGIAHELGNPLSFISSSLQYLHQRFVEDRDPASEFTGAALEHVEQMATLLHNMLDLAAVRRNDLRECDLRQLVSEVLNFTASEAERLHISVQVTAESCPPVWAEPAAIKQLILNLVKNAFEAMTEGGGSLTVRLRFEREKSLAVAEFDNDGPTIPAVVMSRLFLPFYTSKQGGTGLGLYLCKRIARDHRGELQIENLSHGVRYRLSLPAKT